MAENQLDKKAESSMEEKTSTKAKVKFAVEVAIMLIVGYLTIMPLMVFALNFLL